MEGKPLSIGNIIGILFFFVLFIFGMMFSGVQSLFFGIGIIGFLGTVFFVVRIVSDVLKEMHRRNTM